MGMKIEAKVITYYTVELTDEDVQKVKNYLKSHLEESPHFRYEMDKNIAWAVKKLTDKGEINLFDRHIDNKAVKTESWTEDIFWSEFEEQEPEEILKYN